MHRLELRHYRAILALRECRTTIAAAEHLGLTQSAVSHQLSEAERRIGRQLFGRTGRRLSLNTSGELLASSAEKIFKEVEHAERDLYLPQGHTEPFKLRIATFSYSSYRWLAGFLQNHIASYPETVFEFVASPPCVPVRSIENGDADIGITAGCIRSTRVNKVELFKDQLVCVLPGGHRLCEKDFLDAGDFMEDQFITYSAYAEEGLEEDRLWRKFGKRPKLINAGHTEAVIELVKSNFGLTILSKWAVASHFSNGKIEIRKVTKDGLPLNWYAVFCKSHARSDLLSDICESLRKWCQEMRMGQDCAD